MAAARRSRRDLEEERQANVHFGKLATDIELNQADGCVTESESALIIRCSIVTPDWDSYDPEDSVRTGPLHRYPMTTAKYDNTLRNVCDRVRAYISNSSETACFADPVLLMDLLQKDTESFIRYEGHKHPIHSEKYPDVVMEAHEFAVLTAPIMKFFVVVAADRKGPSAMLFSVIDHFCFDATPA